MHDPSDSFYDDETAPLGEVEVVHRLAAVILHRLNGMTEAGALEYYDKYLARPSLSPSVTVVSE
jgi:hypothetical protein